MAELSKSEKVTVCDLSSPERFFSMDRKKFYEEQTRVYKETGKPTKAIAVVNIFLFNEYGEIYVQKRSRNKAHNPGLLDKSMGGHITYGDDPDYTVMVETVQELKVPSIVLRSDSDFIKTYCLLRNYLDTVAVSKLIEAKIVEIPKVIDGKEVIIANKTYLFFGVYGGAVKAVDREARGVLLYSFDDLASELSSSPSIYTNDLKYYFSQYKNKIDDFVELIKSVQNKGGV